MAQKSRSWKRRPAVFLDRDGTINHNVGYIADPGKIQLIPRAAQAVAHLNALGFWVIMVTNQSAIARGLATVEEVERVNSEVALQVAKLSGGHFDGVYYCPYHEDFSHESYQDFCDWRKPAPGMLLQAEKDFWLDMPHSWLIGDGMIDHQAAKAAHPKIKTIVLPSRYHNNEDGPDYYADTLWEAVLIIAEQHNLLSYTSHSRLLNKN